MTISFSTMTLLCGVVFEISDFEYVRPENVQSRITEEPSVVLRKTHLY
jgi:hypothetical protein